MAVSSPELSTTHNSKLHLEAANYSTARDILSLHSSLLSIYTVYTNSFNSPINCLEKERPIRTEEEEEGEEEEEDGSA